MKIQFDFLFGSCIVLNPVTYVTWKFFVEKTQLPMAYSCFDGPSSNAFSISFTMLILFRVFGKFDVNVLILFAGDAVEDAGTVLFLP